MAETIEELKVKIKHQEKTINELDKKYETIFNHSKVGIVSVDTDGKFIEVNQKFCDILGYKKEELKSMTFMDLTFKEDLQKDLKVHEESKRDGTDSFRLEKRYVRKDGSLINAEVFVRHNRDKLGNIFNTTGFITNITKRKKIEDSIIEQTRTMQKYLDIVDVMIVGLDKNGTITLLNQKACEVLGYEEYELIGRNWFKNYLTNENIDEVYDYFLKIINGEANLEEKFINDIKCKDGIRTISWKNKLLKDQNKNIAGIVSSGEDITEILKLEEEKKKSEKALYNQSKMASMGEMLRNIAHQWRQPLSTVSTAASGIKLQKEIGILSDKEFYQGMDAIVDTTQYLSQTIDDFQNYFKTDSKVKEFDCKSFFNNIVNLVTPNYKQENIKLILDNKQVCCIRNLHNELIQIIINILNNAKDAFEGKEIKNKIVILEASFEDDKLLLTVRDNAGGIPEDIINKIFEPYFTTKHQSLGTGIGLYMVKDILENSLGGSVKAYNDYLEYEGEKNLGAVFKLSLPNM